MNKLFLAVIVSLIPVMVMAQSPVTTIFYSIADEDGWVMEESKNANVGDILDSGADGGKALRIGDMIRDRQIMSIVSFDTESLPDCADIVSARLEMTRDGNQGADPFRSLGQIVVDVHPGDIGDDPDLQSRDFEFEVDYPDAAVMGQQGGNLSLHMVEIDPSMLNVEGRTQMRLRFQRADNGNGDADYAGFYAGDNSSRDRHPRLVVEFFCACDVGTDTDTDTDTDTQ